MVNMFVEKCTARLADYNQFGDLEQGLEDDLEQQLQGYASD